jgi:hypothetical protein
VSVTLKALAGVAIVGAATAGAVHIASSPDRHQPIDTRTQRSAPLRSGARGARESAHAGPGGSATRRRESGPKLYRAPIPKSGHAPLDAKAAPGADATLLGVRHGLAAGEVARGRGRSGGASSTHAIRRGSGSAQSPTSRGHRSPKQAKRPARRQTGRQGTGQTTAPASERVPPRGALSHALTTGPGSETASPPTLATASG